MFISIVDRALEKFLQDRLQFPGGSGEISFDTPSPEWADRHSAATVNLFLHRVDRSSAIARAPQRRFDANGRPDRRPINVTMVDLSYLATAWCADPEADHSLLSQLVSVLVANPVVPADFVASGLGSPIALTFGSAEPSSAKPWSVAGTLKAYAPLTVSVAADADPRDDAAESAAAAGPARFERPSFPAG